MYADVIGDFNLRCASGYPGCACPNGVDPRHAVALETEERQVLPPWELVEIRFEGFEVVPAIVMLVESSLTTSN